MPTKPTDAPHVLKMAEVDAMTQSARIDLFKSKDAAKSRLFIDLAKLLIGIRAAMTDPSKATALLKKQGIRPGSVNNASEAARVYQELVPKHLSEAAFDKFRQSDIQAINRCMSGVSAKRLTAANVAELVTTNPKSYDDELESYFYHGMTVAEHKAEEKKAAEERNTRSRSAGVSPVVAGVPPETSTMEDVSGETPDTAGEPPALQSHPKTDAKPANVVEANIPNARADVTTLANPTKPKSGTDKVLAVLEQIDEIEQAIADLSIEEARKVAPVLVALADTVLNYCASTPEEQKAALKAAKAA